MTFVHTAWRVLVGIKDLLVLLLLLLFFLGLWAALNATRVVQTVPSGSALVLNLDGAIVDQATERSPFQLVAGSDFGAEVQVRDIIRAIDTARDDGRIKIITLDLDTFLGAGQANLQSIGTALQRFRQEGKKVYAYATAYTDDSYYLAAQANQIWVNPLGGVLLTGPGGANLYFGKALAKLDIDVNVFRVGTYKAAVEPFTRTDASPEAEVAEQALVDNLWQTYRRDVGQVRKGADITAYLANLPERLKAAGGDEARAAQTARLVDAIGNRAAFNRAVAAVVGDGDTATLQDYNGIAVGDYLAANTARRNGPAVGIVYVTGNIIDGEAPRGTAGAQTIVTAIRTTLARNTDIKALVVRVDSGGGSVLASEEIRGALIEAKSEGLPVIASFGPVAASGGYWVATAADEIYAEPATITGSIGVFAIIPSFNRALAGLNIGTDGVKSTPYSGEPDIVRGLSPATKTILQSSVENIYGRFTGLVAASRKLPVAEVDRIGQGRVWSGETALALKLVDGLGGLDVAVAAAAKRAKLTGDIRIVNIEKPESLPFQLLTSFFGGESEEQGRAQASRDPFARLAASGRLRWLSALGDVSAMLSGPTMQATCTECMALGSPRVGAAATGEGWLARLAAVVR